MFFGLINSPVTFQMMMNDIFRELIDEGVVVIYMDDILIFGGQTKEEHHAILVQVLDILHKHWLYLKAEKCTFGQPTVEYLGLIVRRLHRDGSCLSQSIPELSLFNSSSL